jgi:NAD+ synthase (glutamine-hydrolysing)
MVRLAADELTYPGLLEKLSYIPGLDRAANSSQLVHRLLTCVYQSTRNSSETTLEAARQVAEALGADFLQLDVDGLVQQYVGLISPPWAAADMGPRDLALQNIQRECRADVGCWPTCSALLLATSNRSTAWLRHWDGTLEDYRPREVKVLRRWLSG